MFYTPGYYVLLSIQNLYLSVRFLSVCMSPLPILSILADFLQTLFCCTLLYAHSSIAIILMRKRELVAFLNLSSWCLVMVEWLFLAVPWGCLRFVIVVFPRSYSHTIFELKLIWGSVLELHMAISDITTVMVFKAVFCSIYFEQIDVFDKVLCCNKFINFSLSYDVASGSEITQCNKIDKSLVVYRFTVHINVAYIMTFLRQK